MPKHKHGHATKAAMTRTYRVWLGVRARASGIASPERYADRGIGMCERWADYANFLADMGEQPAGMSLDRIDNDGNYEPGNCQWATAKTQANNRRSSRFIEHLGQRLTLSQWAERAGLSKTTLHDRLASGWPMEQALAVSPNKANRRTACL